MAKYRTLQPFLAFGKTPQVGEIVELTTEQANALMAMDNVAPYEVKVLRPAKEIKREKKQLASARPVRHLTKKTAKRSKKTAKK